MTPMARSASASMGTVPYVDHGRPLFQCDVHARRAGPLRQSERVVEQHLVAADVDQQRGQVAQIGVQR
jgi:hypothetical protein